MSCSAMLLSQFRKALRATVILMVLLLSGCGMFSSLPGIGQVVAGPEKKAALLSEQLEQYHRSLYWGSVEEAALHATAELRPVLHQELRLRNRKERIVDMEIEKVVYEEGTSGANVDVFVRFYQKPHYVVKTRLEREKWTYDRLGGGWQLEKTEVVMADVDMDDIEATSRALLSRDVPAKEDSN